jgi:hypothetical protein
MLVVPNVLQSAQHAPRKAGGTKRKASNPPKTVKAKRVRTRKAALRALSPVPEDSSDSIDTRRHFWFTDKQHSMPPISAADVPPDHVPLLIEWMPPTMRNKIQEAKFHAIMRVDFLHLAVLKPGVDANSATHSWDDILRLPELDVGESLMRRKQALAQQTLQLLVHHAVTDNMPADWSEVVPPLGNIAAMLRGFRHCTHPNCIRAESKGSAEERRAARLSHFGGAMPTTPPLKLPGRFLYMAQHYLGMQHCQPRDTFLHGAQPHAIRVPEDLAMYYIRCFLDCNAWVGLV